jgi:hypothetical protein
MVEAIGAHQGPFDGCVLFHESAQVVELKGRPFVGGDALNRRNALVSERKESLKQGANLIIKDLLTRRDLVREKSISSKFS